MEKSAEYLIWSFEHGAWRGPDRSGYVDDAADAGRFSLAEAERICLQANIPAINEAIVPLPSNHFAAPHPTGDQGAL